MVTLAGIVVSELAGRRAEVSAGSEEAMAEATSGQLLRISLGGIVAHHQELDAGASCVHATPG